MAVTDGILHIDYINGSDSARTALTSCVASNPSGSITRITKNSHGLSNGTYVALTNFSTWLNDTFEIENVNTNYFDLKGTTWQATGDTNGTVTVVGGQSWGDAFQTIKNGATSARLGAGGDWLIKVAKSPAPTLLDTATWTYGSGTVTLDTNDITKVIDNCETSWTALTGIVTVVNATPTNGGSGYTVGDLLTITTGGTGAIVKVKTVSSGVVTALESVIECGGSGYTTGTGKVTSGGTGSGCTVNITTVASASASATNTTPKEGTNYAVITTPTSMPKNSLIAYKAISSTDYSAYQELSLWFKPNSSTLGSGLLKICLCSDTAGTTIVDTFPVTRCYGSGTWNPYAIAKSGGGNLGATIQSIALYTDSATSGDTSNKTFHLDNIIASASNSLNITTLISRNSTERGGTEGWYAIKSINDTTIILDKSTYSKPDAPAIYGNASGSSVNTYVRKTTRTLQASSNTDVVNEITASGLDGKLIFYQGGYNTGTDTQDGITIFDGTNCMGYGIYAISKSYIRLDGFSCFRYYGAVNIDGTSTNWTIDTLHDLSSSSGGANFYSASATNANIAITNILNANNGIQSGIYLSGINITIDTIGNINSNSNTGIYLAGSYQYVNTISNANYNTNYGVAVLNNHDLINTVSNCKNNTLGGIKFGYSYKSRIKTVANCDANPLNVKFDDYAFSNTIDSLTSSNSTTAMMGTGTTNAHDNKIIKLSTTSDTARWSNAGSYKFNNAIIEDVGGNAEKWDEGGYWLTQNATAGGTGKEWRMFVTSSSRDATLPLKMTIAKLAVVADEDITFSVYVKKSHATDIACKIVCEGGQLEGIASDVTATAPSDTTRNSVSLATMTPTESGVLEIKAYVYWVANTADEDVIIDDITVSQA